MLITLSDDYAFKKMTAYTYKLVDKTIIPIVFPIIVDLKKLDNPHWIGEYSRRFNMICVSSEYWMKKKDEADLQKVVHTLCHEIGHAVHFNYLAYVPQYLPRKNPRATWAHYNKDGSENFAECFADYCIAIFEGAEERIANSSRLNKMRVLLEKIKESGCKTRIINYDGEFQIDKRINRQYINQYSSTNIEHNVSYPYAQTLEAVYKKEIIDGPINDISIEKEGFGIPDEELHYVYDYLNPEISEERKIELIGKRRLGRVYKSLRDHGIKPEDYIVPFDMVE